MTQSKFLSLTGLDSYDVKIKDWVEKKGYTTPAGHNHDGRYYTETEVNTLLNNYLKLTGGTIAGTLTINRDASAIHYNNASGTSWGWMGFKAKDTPAVWENTGTTSYNILHAGNSGVSLSGNTLTVKLNDVEKSLSNTTYSAATQSVAGLMSAADKAKLDGIASGANAYSLPLAASGTRGGIQIGYTESGANIPLKLSSEKGYVTLTKNSVTTALGYTPPTTNTTYNAATQSAAGLMSAADKKKLDGIATGANAYTHPDTHPASIITGLATVATSGSYNDLSNKPTIPTSLPANGGNADTVDNKHASDFMAAGDTSHGTHVTNGAQTWSGTKTFSSEVILNGGGTQTDICSGIAAAFKTKRIMANQIITDSIILGASSGTASNKNLTIQKYGKITSTAPDALTTLLTFDTKGRIRRTSGGSWISARDNTIIMQEQTNNAGSSYNPIIGTKTQAGFWSIGSCGGETLYLSYDTDENYNTGNNTSSTILFPTAGRTGTIALTADIPGAATQSAAGLMSAADKKKLDGIATGANAYTHPNTHPASIITGLATVATSGSYNDLSNKPTIPTSLPADGGSSTYAARLGDANGYYTKTSLDTALSGKAAASHGTHVTDGNQTWSGNKAFNGSISLNGNDLYLKTASSSSNDSGDIVFTYGSGNEKCRIYMPDSPTNGNGPYYRVKNSSGTSLYDGRLATIADIPGNATTSKAGLMSAADKTKLDDIDLSGGITKPDGTAGSLQDALNALKTLIDDKANSTHYHSAGDITSGELNAARIPNLAAGKITSGTFDIARIPVGTSAGSVASGNHSHSGYAGATHTHAAGEITSGKFAIGRIPVGTSAGSVALGNHTHSGYAGVTHTHAAGEITSGTFAIGRIPVGTSAGSVALGNHTHSGYMAAGDTSHGTHVTNGQQSWFGTKTFNDGIRIGNDDDPENNDWEPNRTIYFGDDEYVAIYESPADTLSLKGNLINVNTSTTHTNVTIPSIEGYSQSSTGSWSASSKMSSTYNVTTSYTNMTTRSATSSYSLHLYISGTSTYYGYSVPPGQTIRIDVGTSFMSYVAGRQVSTGGCYCSSCDSYIDYVDVIPATGWMPYMYIKFYLTTSSSSTSPISGAYVNISMPWHQGYNTAIYGGGGASTPSVQSYIEYTNTGSSYQTVYLRGQIYRDAASGGTCSGITSGNWLFFNDSSFDYFPRCTNCGSNLININQNIMNSYSPGTFYHYFGSIITFRKSVTYTKNTFEFPSIYKFTGKNAIINNGIINNYSNLFTGTGVTYTSSGFINSNNQLCYKFPGANSVFYADKDKLSYIIGGSSNITTSKPNLFFNIDNSKGLQLLQDYYYQQLNDAKLSLQYSSTILTIDYDSIISNVTNDLEIGSSTYKCYRIYSSYFYGTVSSSSDERFKEWQSDIDIDFDKLKTIPKKIFKWKDSFLKTDDDLHIGTSAQAIRDIYPEIVHIYNEDNELCGPRDIYDPDAVLTVDYDKLGVIALAAIDKLHEENVQLKEENEQLKTRLDNLEAILKEKGIL